MDNLIVANSKIEEVKTLEELSSIALEKGIGLDYLEEAKDLDIRMNKNITVKTIFEEFKAYPVIEYPEPIHYDPKTKKAIDPVTKKPLDAKKLAALLKPKKKKKKQKKEELPPWASVENLEEKIKTIEELMKKHEEYDLRPDFIDICKEQVDRMKKELKNRKYEEDEKRRIAEEKKAKNKKKK